MIAKINTSYLRHYSGNSSTIPGTALFCEGRIKKCTTKKGGESMETKDLKKYLAGFGIVGLIAGAGLAVGANTGNAESS
jgi:radical SAM modification target selenobiotic family peptide